MAAIALLIATALCMVMILISAARLRHAGRPAAAQADSVRSAALRARIVGFTRIRASGHARVLLRRIIRRRESLPALQLVHEHARDLSIALLRLQGAARSLPPLPRNADGARMAALCSALVQEHASPSPADLLAALRDWQSTAMTTFAERQALPVVMQLTLERRLAQLLFDLELDANQHHRGVVLAGRLMRSRRPVRRLLRRRRPDVICLCAMIDALRDAQQHELLAALEAMMDEAGASLARIRETHMHRQTALAQQLEKIITALLRLQQADWGTLMEQADPLHRLFLDDPSGCYGRLTPASRTDCRRYAARLAARFHADEIRIGYACIDAAHAAQDDAPRDHIGYYLFTLSGQQMLRRMLRARSGFFRTVISGRQTLTSTITASALSVCLGWLVLDVTQRLLPSILFSAMILPTLLPLSRRWLQRCFALPQPVIDVHEITGNIRTLLVLPATLTDASGAIAAVRRLLVARDACPPGEIDLMLLADYRDNLTARASDDAAIATAARAAAEAIDQHDSRVIYLQRCRTLDAARRCYGGKQGMQGLLSMLNALLVHGECDDLLDYATIEPEQLHRRYAYVLVLTEDAELLPDALLSMIGVMEYPLYRRWQTMQGIEGSSMLTLRRLRPDGRPVCRTPGSILPTLYQPDSLMEDCGGLPFPGPLSPAAQAAAHACESRQPAAIARKTQPSTLPERWQTVYQLFRSLPWLLSEGRIALAASLIPVSALLLILWGCLTRQPLLILVAFAALTASCLLTDARGLMREIILLPLHAILHGTAAFAALYDLLRDHPFRSADTFLPHRRIAPFICWTQGICAALAGGLSLITLPVEWIFLGAGVLFACFPLPYYLAERPKRTADQPDGATLQRIRDVSYATWRYFDAMTASTDAVLPPDTIQDAPPLGSSAETSPEAIAAVLLAIIAACDQGLLAPQEAARRMALLLDAVAELERWHGLFYARYGLVSRMPAAPLRIESVPNGLLCYALLLSAQALRSRLAELPETLHSLPARLDDLADRMRLRYLYDSETGLFFERISMPDRTGIGRHDCFASPALPLSFIAVMRREIPAAHLFRLSRARVRLGFHRIMLGQTGSIADYALPPLLLPCPPRSPWDAAVRVALRRHVRRPHNGMVGLSEALSPSLDASLRSRRVSSGLLSLAARTPDSTTLISPHAAAMLLTRFPHQALAALSALEAASMFGASGFYDGYDLNASEKDVTPPVRAYDTLHQGLLLCACSDALGFSPAKYFSMLPGAAAWAAILQLQPSAVPVLAPPRTRSQPAFRVSPPHSREGLRLRMPPDAHIIGSTGASALISADGYTVMQGDSLYWTRFTGSAGLPEGMRLCASNGKRAVRIGQGGHTEFHEGHAVFHETLGKLRLTLHIAVDPISAVVWHLMEIVNSAASIRHITIGNLLTPLLRPDRDSLPPSISVDHPEKGVLTAAAAGETGMLCHAISSTVRLTTLRAATDTSQLDALLSSLLNAPRDASPCLSFLCDADIPGRGHAEIAFATAYAHDGIPDVIRQCPAAERILSISHLYSRIQQEQFDLLPDQALHCLRMIPFLFWRGLPQQGAMGSLSVPQQALCALGINIHLPLLLLSVSSGHYDTLLAECCAAASLLAGRGFPIALCVLCRGENSAGLCESIRRTVEFPFGSASHRFPCTVLDAAALADGVRTTLEAAAALLLTDDRDLLPQLRTMQYSLRAHPLPAAPKPPLQQAIPLLFPERYGGFHPSTQAYIHLAHPEDNAPAAWTRMIADRRFGTRVSADGPLASFAGPMLCSGLTHHDTLPAETFFLEADGRRVSPCLFPYGDGCAIRVHHQPGVAVWHAEGAEIEMKLTLAPLPGYSAGVRILRIRNMADHSRSITLHAAVCFAPGGRTAAPYVWITPFAGLAVATAPDCALSAYFAAIDGIGSVRRMTTAEFHGFLVLHGASSAPGADTGGSVALLSRAVTLEAGASEHISFLLGAARSMDELERAMEHVQSSGASAVIRIVRQKWAQRLRLLTISTSNEALDLMMNQLLPAFLHTLHPEQSIFARLLASAPSVFTGGRTMRARLLHAAAHMTHTSPERPMLPMLVAWYIDRSGDTSILDARLPATDDTQPERDTLALRCAYILTGVALNTDGLPLTGSHATRLGGLRYIVSLRAFEPYLPPAMQTDAHRMIDLVTDAVRHTPVDSHPCLQACWEVFAGLSHRLPVPCDPADFREAAALLQALCLTGEHDHAWRMADWLNPILHHSAHIPPWQPEAGGSGMHAAWVYVAILEGLLGLRRHGDGFQLHPRLPEAWDGFSLQLTIGTSTWHIDCARDVVAPQCDGESLPEGVLHPIDDGRIHQAKFPVLPSPKPPSA